MVAKVAQHVWLQQGSLRLQAALRAAAVHQASLPSQARLRRAQALTSPPNLCPLTSQVGLTLQRFGLCTAILRA